MQILKMDFIGKDGSLGYVEWATYTLCVMASLEKIMVFCAENPEGFCVYDDVNKLFENWRLP